MSGPKPRRLLLRWMGWFGLTNALILAVISLGYVSGFEGGGTLLSWVYVVAVFVGHFSWLALLPLFVLCGPLLLVWPRQRPLQLAAVLLYASMIALVVLDCLLWSQSRFHINLLTAKILGWQSWVFLGVMFLIALWFESMAAAWVWRRVAGNARLRGGLVGAVVAALFLVAQGIYAWADASYYTPVTSVANQLPVHRGITAKKLLVRTGLVNIEQSRERQLAERLSRGLDEGGARTLDYPLEPLQCDSATQRNLLVIMLDAWRFDMFNDRLTPNIRRWADANAVRFTHHYSGGNSSRMGLFSFFYGLPPGYFQSFEAEQYPALLVSKAQGEGYQLGLFTSDSMYRPISLDRTAFAGVPGLRIQPSNLSAPPWQRDQELVDEWTAWLDARDSAKPFFGFLLFDSSNQLVFPPDYPFRPTVADAHPMAEQLRAYQTAIHFLDSLVQEVLTDLERRGLAEDTVVMITSDHGEEFSESGSSYRRHGSGYSRYQLQVPMLVAVPGMPPATVARRTSHYDVAPTLLGRLFGCRNDPADYSEGTDLFSGESWDWLVAGSYYNYAVVEPDQVTVAFPNGRYEVRDSEYQISDDALFRSEVLLDVMHANQRFHR